MKAYLLIIYAPQDAVEDLKEGLFAFGCGRLGHYERCCWSVDGVGQFHPLIGANPAIGSVGAVEKVSETRLEMIYVGTDLKGLKSTIRAFHPYEEPGFAILSMH